MFLSAATVLGFVFFAFVIFVLTMRARRRGRAPHEPPNFDFSLDELHGLHDSGQLNTEEFERVKAAVLTRQSASRGAADRDALRSGRGFNVLPPGSPPSGA